MKETFEQNKIMMLKKKKIIQIASLPDIAVAGYIFTTTAKEEKNNQLSELRAVINLFVS